MGNLNYIVFGGVDSRDYGIYISGEGVFNAPERDVEVVNIPGKDGDLLIDRGRFLNIQVTYPGFNFEPDLSTFAERLRAFRAALASQTGYQRLEDSFHPDEFRLASFRSGLDVNPIMYNTASTFDIVFDCKPQRFLKSGEEEITIGEWGETETITGNIATFEGTDTTAIKSVVAQIVPIQDLHGYDKPWSGGAGKNKANIDGATNLLGMALSNSALANTLTDSKNQLALYAATYKESTLVERIISVAYSPSVGRWSGRYTINNTDFDRIRIWHSGSTQDLSAYIPCSVPTTGDYMLSINFLGVSPNVVGGFSFKEVQFEAGSTATSYEPYSNICPISGWDEVEVEQCGKNLLQTDYILGWNNVQVVDGTVTATRTDTRTWNPILQAYNGNTFVRNLGAAIQSPFAFTKDDSFNRILFGHGGAAADIKCRIELNDIPNGDYYFSWEMISSTGIFSWHNMMISKMIAPYSPYTGQSHSITLPSTVYGGEVDVISGEGKKIMGYVDLGSLNWSYNSTYAVFIAVFPSDSLSPTSIGRDATCERYLAQLGVTLSSLGDGKFLLNSTQISSATRLAIKDTAYTDVTAFKTAISGTKFVYELATPTDFTTTPTEINTLDGVNNIWADTGDVSVEIGEDPNILVNPTPFEALPLFEVVGTGSLTVGNTTIGITGDSTQDIFIDSDIMEAYEDDNGAIISRNDRINLSGTDFPKLGEETRVESNGLTSVKITPRWWTI